jgi:hypothetical protein
MGGPAAYPYPGRQPVQVVPAVFTVLQPERTVVALVQVAAPPSPVVATGASENCPVEQAAHLVAVPPGLYWFAVHAVQVFADKRKEYPALQAVQTAEEVPAEQPFVKQRVAPTAVYPVAQVVQEVELVQVWQLLSAQVPVVQVVPAAELILSNIAKSKI